MIADIAVKVQGLLGAVTFQFHYPDTFRYCQVIMTLFYNMVHLAVKIMTFS